MDGTTALEGPSSMKELLSSPLKHFEDLTHQLFLSLSMPNSTPSPSIEAFVQCDNALAAALIKAREHQLKQRRIEQLKEDVVNLEWQLKAACQKLLQDKADLEAMIREGDERVKTIDSVEKGSKIFYCFLFCSRN